jgi:hypothetical protein
MTLPVHGKNLRQNFGGFSVRDQPAVFHEGEDA